MSESAPISRSAQRNLDLMRHRDETLARWPANYPVVAEWLDQFRDDEAGRQQCRFDGEGMLKSYAEQKANYLWPSRRWSSPLRPSRPTSGWPCARPSCCGGASSLSIPCRGLRGLLSARGAGAGPRSAPAYRGLGR